MDAPIEVLLQHWPGVLFRQSPDLRFQFISERIVEWTGHPPAAWLEQPDLFLQCVHEDDVKALRPHLAQVEHSPEGARASFRLRHARTGRVTQVSEFRRAAAGKKGGAKCHEGFWLEDAPPAAASWAEVLARLTPGFAHDFNNVIAGVHGLSDAYLSQIEPGHPFHDGLELMKKNTLQGAKLVQCLQQLYRLRPGERTFHDLNAVAQDCAELLRRGFSKRFEIVAETSSTQLPVHADAAELQHAILALACHALDAMNGPGRLTLRTAARSPSVNLFIHDETRVLQPAEAAALLEGGLRLARRLVENQRGSLAIETKAGHGTNFFLTLPQADFTEGR